MKSSDHSLCIGCSARLPVIVGPTHEYMESSPACYALFTRVLAYEYSDPALLETHRLTVDTYAVQHPGRRATRQQIQSVGLHLARLGLQLDNPVLPKETNDIMLDLGRHKHTLVHLTAPSLFNLTIADVADHAGTKLHSDKVKEWAEKTWNDWSEHHAYIRHWTSKWL